MQNRKRLTNVLIAGTLTVLVLTMFLAFRGGGTAVAETSTISEPTISEPTSAATTSADTTAVTTNTDIATLQAQIEALQAQNTELRTAVETMQEREAEYQRQIEIANQTITELSAQTGSLAVGGGLSGESTAGSGLFGFAVQPHSHGGHNH